jgi:hypothetical protein
MYFIIYNWVILFNKAMDEHFLNFNLSFIPLSFVMVYKKGYQEVGNVDSAIVTKVKGILTHHPSLS